MNGYNYRMSNIQAGVGRGQLRVLGQRVAAKRRILALSLPKGSTPTRGRWVIFPASASCLKPHGSTPWGLATRWLTVITVITVDPARFGSTREGIRLALERENMASRPVWKPMHLQPVFAGYERVVGEGPPRHEWTGADHNRGKSLPHCLYMGGSANHLVVGE